MSTNTFLGLAERLLTDPSAKDAYADDPEGFLEAEGFGALSTDEVATGLRHVAQVLPPTVAEAVDPDAGLDGLAELDLAALGVDDLEDFSTPLDVEDLAAPDDGDADEIDDIDGLGRAASPQTVDAIEDTTDADAGADDTDDVQTVSAVDIDAEGDDAIDLDDDRPAIAVTTQPDIGLIDDGALEPTFDDIDQPSFADIDADEPQLDTEVPDDERWDLFDL